ncbi:BglII/BstYI family type II restriction endonuclease [Pseudomonas sp. MAC6]|uniref:BglII/BstYI family type II restriction endonuclease n=1 Tax=Pseudomonas sp. MAC6 TaxID=3401633 RepID=UPI003BF6197B
MKVDTESYRFASEILQHANHRAAWDEISEVLENTPLFIYPGKSSKNKKLDVVQQVMNTYFDRRLSVDLGWEYHPLATRIENSGLAADFRKSFGEMVIQVEVQFGNMSRWYSDIFKFQTAYSQSLINIGLCVLPTAVMARRIDSNVAQYERALRELPSAELSITLPIVLAGLTPDENTETIDISRCQFQNLAAITGRGGIENRWRIVHGYLNGIPMEEIGPHSDTGPLLQAALVADASEE